MKISKKILLSAFTLLPLLTTNQLYASTPTGIVSDGKDSRTDYILSASMTNGAINCGPGLKVINGWTIDTEAYFNHNGIPAGTVIQAQGGFFATGTGIFTTPLDGFYQINASARIQTQAGDLTLRLNNTTRVAGFGTDLVEHIEGTTPNFMNVWSSHSVTKNIYLEAGDTISLWHEAGQADDCILATSFKYTQFNVMLIRATGSNG